MLDRLRAFFSSRTDIGDALTPLDLEARAFDAAVRNAFTLSKRWLAMPRALLAGRHPIELTPTRLLRLSRNLPQDWMEQRRFLGLAA